MRALWAAICLLAMPAWADGIEPLTGWAVYSSGKSYETLVDDTKAAVKENGLIVVTQAGPTKAAASRGITIPGNRVIGAFNNDYAVRVLETSTNAMIEAPIRFLRDRERGRHCNPFLQDTKLRLCPLRRRGRRRSARDCHRIGRKVSGRGGKRRQIVTLT